VMEERDYAGCCGLYCGLCPRFQSTAPSRCLGCQLGEQHNYCSVWRCCVKKNGFHTCAECSEFPCERLMKVIGVGVDSFISHRPAIPNLERIRQAGEATHLAEQRERRLLLEDFLARYNEGRSMSFYCTACTLLPVHLLHQALGEIEDALSRGQVPGADIKAKAKTMRSLLQELARQTGVDLTLRKG